MKDLVSLSRRLGKPESDCVILGEGNTSAKIDPGTFLVKTSGSFLETIDESGFIALGLPVILSAVLPEDTDTEKVAEAYEAAKQDRLDTRKPSVETAFHAVCLSYEGINFVAHTHPSAVNKLTCSETFPENLKGRIYPDEIVLLGIESITIEYLDPGLILARRIKKEIDAFIGRYGMRPRVIFLQNHGMISLGSTAREALNITIAAQKSAEIRRGAQSSGGMKRLDDEAIQKISNREDEKYRQKFLL